MGDVYRSSKAEQTIANRKRWRFTGSCKRIRSRWGFRDQLGQMRQIGSVDQMLGMLPKVGIFKDAGKVRADERNSSIEAIINS
jgi:signal recognition particle GTPase